MAETSKKILEGKRAELEAKQAKAVEALYFKNEAAVDLQLAQDIGLVTAETRAKIEGVYGPDSGEELFGKVLQKQASGEKPSAAEFTRAFEIVYGKFLLEQRDAAELERPDGQLMQILGKVLRFPVEEIDGQASIMGRPELAAAVRRLKLVDSGEKAEERVLEMWRQNRDDIVDKGSDIGELVSQLEKLENKKREVGALKPSLDFEETAVDAAAKERTLQKISDERGKLRNGEWLEGAVKLDEATRAETGYRDGIQIMQNQLRDAHALIAGYDPTLDVLREINDVADDLDRFIRQQGFDSQIWERFLKEKLSPLVDKLGSRAVFRSLTKAAKATAKLNNTPVDPIRIDGAKVELRKLGEDLKFLRGNIDKMDKYKKTNADFDAIVQQDNGLAADEQRFYRETAETKRLLASELWEFHRTVLDFRMTGIIPTEVVGKIAEFLTAYDAMFNGKAIDDIPSEDLLAFVRTTYQPLLNDLEEAFDVSIGAKAAELQQNRVRLAEMEEKGEQMERFDGGGMTAEKILQKAFPGVKLENGNVTIRGFETNFKHAAEQLQEAEHYFSSVKAMDELRNSMQILQTLSKDVDPNSIKDKAGAVDDSIRDQLGDDLRTQANVIESTIASLQGGKYTRKTAGTADQEREFQKLQVEQAAKAGKLKDLLNVINAYLSQAKTVRDQLHKLMEHLENLKDAQIPLQKKDGTNIEADKIEKIVHKFKKINIERSDFNPKELIDSYAEFDEFFDDPVKVNKFADKIKKVRQEIATSTNLTDAQAAKNIIGAIIAEQDPKLPLADQKKLSAMMLAGDVMKLQSAEDYRTLAERGGADFLDTVKQVGFMEKVIGFQYKVGDKVEKPFEGLKPGQFAKWENIENLFATKRLDYKGGFLLLAAFETFNEKSAQIAPLSEKLKELLAAALGVEDRMSEAGVVAIVNEAFEKQLESTRPLVQAYFGHVDKKRDIWETNRVRALNAEHKALRDLYRTGGIGTDQYRQRLEELREKAESAGVLDQVGFAQSSIMKSFAGSDAGKWLRDNGIDADQTLNVFWNNPVSQWFRDRGFDLARASGNAAGRILGRGALGTLKLGGSLGLQTALTPLRFGKYALMAAGMPFVGFVNLFRKQKWTPYSLKATVSQDVSRAIGYVGTTGKGIATGVAGTAKDVVTKDLVGAKGKKYEEKLKVKPDKGLERAKELWEKGQASPLKIASEPWVDLEKYKAKVKELDTILAGKEEKKAA